MCVPLHPPELQCTPSFPALVLFCPPVACRPCSPAKLCLPGRLIDWGGMGQRTSAQGRRSDALGNHGAGWLGGGRGRDPEPGARRRGVERMRGLRLVMPDRRAVAAKLRIGIERRQVGISASRDQWEPGQFECLASLLRWLAAAHDCGSANEPSPHVTSQLPPGPTARAWRVAFLNRQKNSSRRQFLFSSPDSHGRPATAPSPQSALRNWHSALWCYGRSEKKEICSLITVVSFNLAAVSFYDPHTGADCAPQGLAQGAGFPSKGGRNGIPTGERPRRVSDFKAGGIGRIVTVPNPFPCWLACWLP